MKIKAFLAGLLAVVMLFGTMACAKAPVDDDIETSPQVTEAARPIETEVANEDGEIVGERTPDSSDFVVKDGVVFEDVLPTPAEETEMDAEWTMATPDIAFPEAEPHYDKTNEMIYGAGTLTAGEWHDNGAWSDWLDKADQDEWRKITEIWKVLIERRIVVTVKNGENAVRGAKAELLSAAGEVVWSAVSDHEGKAYLFCLADDQARASDKPVSVRVSAEGCEAVNTALDAEDEISIQLAAINRAPKLDLMFVVDTTGSMSDELEYLKAELEDVVKRVEKESELVSVRTSVNFYRDEGDEYVVRYFGFKQDIAEAVQNISAQSANGGGDYEEAVHTALDNAVNAHAWDADSVKLMFLVLDAPPHEQKEVIESLGASVKKAASMGIHIIPVMASGTDTTCEVLFRSIAILTGGTYAFLTNDSGVGNPHADQSVGAFNVEKLNDLMVRVIKQYCA